MKNNTSIIIAVLLLIFSCKKENNILAVQNINTTTDSIKIINLPIDSTSFRFNNKDKNGYFIYDKTYKKNNYINSLSKIFGKFSLNKEIDLLLIEKRTNDDEYTEPIVILYSFEKNKKQKIDSLNLYETINSEATATKRFLIEKNMIIHIYENSSGYDFSEDGRETLIIEKKHSIYKISENGNFILQKDKHAASLKKKNVSSPDKSWFGSYSIKSNAISNADSKKFTLRYYITINSLSDAVLSIGADNPQDYTCEGNYVLQIDSNTLYGSGKCDSDDTNDFYIKKENGKYFIKSKRFINQDWQELKKEQ